MRALRQPAFWAWLILASVPADLLAWAKGWQMVDPAYLALAFLAWPLDSLGRLGALRLLLADPISSGKNPETKALLMRLPSALAAEVLLSLRSTVRLLLGQIPALFWLSVKGLESPAARMQVLTLATLGLIHPGLYLLRRSLAPIKVLEGSKAAAALDASARELHGRLAPFLMRYLPWGAAGWALDGLGLLLPDPWGSLLTPLSAALGLLGLVRAAAGEKQSPPCVSPLGDLR